MNGGWIPAEVRRRVGSFRVQRIADYMRCHCREEEAFSDAPVPEKLLSRPGSLNLFGHSRREIGVKDAFSQRSHIFQTFPLGQTCRSPIDGEHIPSSMHREVRRRIHVNFFPNFSGHAPIFFYHLSCSLRLDETVSFFLTALLIAFKSCWFTLPNNRSLSQRSLAVLWDRKTTGFCSSRRFHCLIALSLYLQSSWPRFDHFSRH